MKNKVTPLSANNYSLVELEDTWKKEVWPETLSTGRKEINFKYAEVWQRARVKLRATYYISKFEKTLDMIEKNHVLENESIIDDSLPFGILHPYKAFKSWWNLLILVTLLYTAVIMPFSVAFIQSDTFSTIDYFDIAIDFIYLIDFSITCSSAYYDESGKLIFKRSQILLNYLKSWMIIDLISSLPYSLMSYFIQGNTKSANKFIKFLRLPRLYKLLRLSRLFKLINSDSQSEFIIKVQDYLRIRNSVSRFFKGIATVLIAIHIISCMWYYSAKLENFAEDTWVTRLNYLDSDTATLYISSLYWAFTTLSTVGYGDIYAVTISEKLICVVWMFFGCYFLAFIIGSLSAMLAKIETTESALMDKLVAIDQFALDAKISKSLTRELKHAIKYSTQITGFSWLDKQNLLDELPKTLKYEVSLAMHFGAARKISFFMKKDFAIVSAIVPFLTPLFTSAKEFVYNAKDFADEMYFIVKGAVEYVYQQILTVCVIHKSNYFGDIELIFQVPRKYSAKALCSLEMLAMNRSLLLKLKIEYRCIWEDMKAAAIETDKTNLITQNQVSSRAKKTMLKSIFSPVLREKSKDKSSEISEKIQILSNFAIGLATKFSKLQSLSSPLHRPKRSKSM